MEKNTTKIDLDYYEKVVMYNCLFDSGYLGAIIDHLNPSIFMDKDIKCIISIITDFYIKRSEVPSLVEIKTYTDEPSSKESLKSLGVKLRELENVKFNRDELFENTETFLKERSVYNTLLEAAQKLDGGNLDSSALLIKMEKAVGINLSTSIGMSLLDDVDHFINELSKNESKISSGWRWLDNKISGGFCENGRALYVFIGETNVGKSIFLGNVAANVAMQGKTCLVISLEMSEIMYGMRFASNLTKIPMFELKNDFGKLKNQLNNIKKRNKESKILIKEFPPSTISPFQVAAYLKKLQQRGIKVDCLVLDYLNLMDSGVKGVSNMYERVKHISEQLRAVSYKFSIPVITASQINRSGYNSASPSLETISEGISLANTADAIFNIWQTDEDKDNGFINMGIAKNRFGPNFGSTMLKIDYTTLTLSEEDVRSGTDEVCEFNKSIKSLED
jgi:replicative DNA helicase